MFMSRLADQIRRNPALVRTLLVSVFVIVGTYVSPIPEDVQNAILSAVTVLVALVVGGTSAPAGTVVVQETRDGDVVASDASQLPNGTAVTVDTPATGEVDHGAS